MKIIRAIGRFILDIFEVFIMAAAMFVVSYIFFFQPHQVNGNSMLPNFIDKELVLTNKVAYGFKVGGATLLDFGGPKRGEVVIFEYPKDPETEYIKRIIGLPGEKIRIADDKVYIYNDGHPDGFALEEPYIPPEDTIVGKSFLPEGVAVDIPEGNYVALGDNRPVSSDSREWGFVPKENLVGKSLFIYWPVIKTRIIKTPHY